MMKLNYILAVLFSLFQSCFVFARQNDLEKEELENFLVITDRDFYLSGDRVWFAAKLLKNHESYRYSKLAYIAVLDAEGKPVHQEKMLLNLQDMAYGDLFIPETARSGVFSIVVYTKWMSNFGDFPIAQKEFLVLNPTAQKPAGEPTLFWEKVPYENAPVSIFHTSDRAEVVEILDQSGKVLEVMEAVSPLTKSLSKVKPTEGYQLVFRNKTYSVMPQHWVWDVSDFSLRPLKSDNYKIVTHTDWMVLEEIKGSGEKISLDRARYKNLSNFKISVLDEADKLVWSYQVQLPGNSAGEMLLEPKGKTGEGIRLDLTGFPQPVNSGLVMAVVEESPRIRDFVEILNHPNWENLNEESRAANLVTALRNPMQHPLLLKDYSPMFDYKPWSVTIQERFKSTVSPRPFGFAIPEEAIQAQIDRRVYQEHFGIADEVVELQSPFDADKVYELDQYEEFPNMESLIKEIVPQIRMRKSQSGVSKEIFVANTDDQHVKFNKKPLVLIDFYRPVSMEEVWNLDLTTLDRIELYYHRTTVEATNLGEAVGDGLIVLYTKNNGYFLKNNVPKGRYFLSDVSVPRIQNYSQRNAKSITANSLQFLDPGLRFDRGRSRTQNLQFDTAGGWLVKAWVFGNSEYGLLQKRIQVEP